ncbi:MAG: M20 aminoacylase family protein [Boseongicola sp.]
MPVLNRIAGFADEMAEWRQWLHRTPELCFDLPKTAAFVAEKLRAFGVDELHEGIARTGIVAIINGQGTGPTIGLRADMDALPISEESELPYASQNNGRMHACGHDGHTAMLLGAARYLAETRRFKGRVALIFQPAEESIGGARVMIEEGIMERFDIAQIYAIHTTPERPLGHFVTAPGPVMASADDVKIRITGVGGHAATPEASKDPLTAAVAMVQAFQTIVSRNSAASDRMVLSVTQLQASSQASNVIGDIATIGMTVRTFTEATRDLAETRVKQIANGHAAAFDVEVEIDYDRSYPATVNHAENTRFAVAVASDVVGKDHVDDAAPPAPWSEDFSFMLQKRPGAYLELGQGIGPGLHTPTFNFNDEAAPIGASFFACLVEQAQPLDT